MMGNPTNRPSAPSPKRKAKYRLGLNESQANLRAMLQNVSHVIITQMLGDMAGLVGEPSWSALEYYKVYFTIQGISDNTTISTKTIDKYVHAFLGLSESDPAYKHQRITVDHRDAPLISPLNDKGYYEVVSGHPFRRIIPSEDGSFREEDGNPVFLPGGVVPHRLVSTRAMLFAILAPVSVKSDSTKILAVRRGITAKYGLPRTGAEKIGSVFREFERKTNPATPPLIKPDLDSLSLFKDTPEPATQELPMPNAPSAPNENHEDEKVGEDILTARILAAENAVAQAQYALNTLLDTRSKVQAVAASIQDIDIPGKIKSDIVRSVTIMLLGKNP